MSVSLIIVLLLIIAYRAGARRGLVQTIVNVVGYVAVAFAASARRRALPGSSIFAAGARAHA